MKKILALIFISLAFLPVKVYAVTDHVVINEFLPNPSSGEDWVELYNPTGDGIDISGWVLRDTAASVMKTIPSSTIISSHGFHLEYVDSRLNMDSDTIYLRTSASSSENIDSKSYSTNPGTGVSIGRSPDGEDNWVTFNTPTPDSSNNPATSTPTPTPTSTSISTPTPSLEPTENPTPTPTIEPTLSPSPTATITSTPTPSPTILPSPSSTFHPTPTPINFQEIFEKRMTCRFSYSRLRRLPNADYFINLLKSIFGPQSVCP